MAEEPADSEPEPVSAAVAAAADVRLDRLGSQKYLLAATDATLEADAVLAGAASERRRAAETFDAWADDESHRGAREMFAAIADRERDAAERLVDERDDLADGDGDDDAAGGEHDREPGRGNGTGADALHAHLRDRDDTVERVAAGLVGGGLVADRTLLQYVSFFVNEGDDRRAQLFREFRAAAADDRDAGDELLADLLSGADERERARDAAVAAIDAAYEEYAGALDTMGLDPKPLC